MHAITSDNHRGRVADGLYARFFSGLADETRLRIVRYLLERPRTVGEIVAALGMSQSRISCTGTDYLDTVLQLRPPFAWHKPDGLRGVT